MLLPAAWKFMWWRNWKRCRQLWQLCWRTHQYNSSFGCGKLHQDPFVTVWSPHAEPVSFRQPDCQQTGCKTIHLQTGNEEELGLDYILPHRCSLRWTNLKTGTTLGWAVIFNNIIDKISEDFYWSWCLIIVCSLINHPDFEHSSKVQTLWIFNV